MKESSINKVSPFKISVQENSFPKVTIGSLEGGMEVKKITYISADEIVSTNEELLTVNEELGALKDEMEFTYEELKVINQELQTRLNLLNQSYDFSEAIIATMHDSMVILDKNLRVKSASKNFYKNFKVTKEETEGVLLYDLGNRQWNIPRLRELLEDILPKKAHFHDFEIIHSFPFIGEKIMLLNASRIDYTNSQEDLIVLAFADVTEVRKLALEKEATEKKRLLKKIETEQELKELLEAKQKQLHDIFLNTPAAIAIFEGHEHKFILANQSYEKITNRKVDDLLGKSKREVFPELIGTGNFELFDKVFETGEPYIAPEFVIMLDLKNDGVLRQCYFNFSINPLKNDFGKIYGLIVMFYEITEQIEARKKVEDSEKRYNMMLMQSPFGFAVLKGEDMVVALANDSIKQIWGKGNQIEGDPLIEILPELKDQQFPVLLHDVYMTGIPYTANEALVRMKRYGKMEELYFNFVYQPYRETDGSISGVTVIAIEVTDEVKSKKIIEESENKYRKLNETLDQEVASRTIEITQQKEFSETILNCTIDLIGVFDKQMRIIGFNKASEDFFRIKKEDILGKLHVDVFPGLKGGQFENDLQLSLTGETIHNEIYHSTVTGRYYENFLTPLKDEKGEVYAAVAIAHDITESMTTIEKIKESEEKFNKLFNVSPISKTLSDAISGKIVMVNDAFTEVFGYSREEVLHKDSIELGMINPIIFETLINELRASGKSNNKEIEFTKKSGEKFFALASTEIIEIGNKPFFLAVYNDISERKKAEKATEQKNAELLVINKELEAFTYVSSHDLQAPLRSISIMADRILDKEVQNLSDDGKNYFRLMQNSTKRMQTLIQELLAFSRLSIADREFEATDLKIIIEEAKSDFKDVIAEKHAVITVNETCNVKIIPFQFRQLMHNLIGNSLKFSKPDTPPCIIINCETLKSHPQFEGIEVSYITISDNGIGFDKEYAEKIFEVFQRLHGQEAYVGTGIGLAIVKKIVENHNGFITATSELAKGTTFHIYIPTS